MMNVPLILLAVIFLPSSGVVTGQFTAPPPTCPGDNFTFRCTVRVTVTGNRNGVTIWRVNGSKECSLVHSTAHDPGPCGSGSPFTATPGTEFGTSATSFTSTLSGTATSTLNGTLVECFGPTLSRDAENMVGNSALQILGPPSGSTLSCVALSGDGSGAVNVTVSWTLSGRDSADFYLINITTNASQTPYGGLLNITTANVTQHELTGFMAGCEHNITVRGVNCGSQEGRESKPLTITPQVPVVPTSCNITLLYKSTGRLEHIVSTWSSVPDPVDPDTCLGSSGDITQYQVRFQTGSVVVTDIMSPTECTAGICTYTYIPASNLLNNSVRSSYDSVSVAAENVVAMGAARTCTEYPINMTNNLLAGEEIEVTSSYGATLNCTFLPGFTGSARCTVHYGTDPAYTNLPYSAESAESGSAGDTVSVVLRERLNFSTVYYYTVSAVSGDTTVVIKGNFTTPLYAACNQPSLLEWSIALIVTGVLALVVAIVVIITGTLVSYTRKYKKTQWQILCFILAVIAALFGMSLGIALGVVVSNGNKCDKNWPHTQTGLFVLGFAASIMTFIFAAAAVVWVYVHNKKSNRGCHTEPDRRAEEVNLQDLEVKKEEERYCTVQHGHTSPGSPDQTHSRPITHGVMYADLAPHTASAAVSPPTIDGSVQYALLVHDQTTANQRPLEPAGAN